MLLESIIDKAALEKFQAWFNSEEAWGIICLSRNGRMGLFAPAARIPSHFVSTPGDYCSINVPVAIIRLPLRLALLWRAALPICANGLQPYFSYPLRIPGSMRCV
jgi:hypothetical protein